ncbi:GspMb/PilO family protein [Paucibacter sp. APW11]|uniref:GspMb/PilO family protein n=1 Tax=Roseateles aquae TaxID=3077235 RepID=A0ABU3PEC4_9BURK|nr:GspMb/PilO family protein [Paucibacter sp. APW11]MDT9000919.1 GspMb/PilO family protein [Paucibacter sp. APW11]
MSIWRSSQMAVLVQRARQFAQSLGAPGLLGLLCLALAAPLALWAVPHWQAQGEQMEARLQAQRRQLLALAAAPAQAEVKTPEQWRIALPDAEQRQQRLADLLEIGLRAGLASTRTEHRLSVDARNGLERLRVSMPVQGGYAQLRRFIETALSHDPALSLDSLKLRRQTPQAAELEAELVWSLHARAAVAVTSTGGQR